ncbi:arginase family protein [Streptomyces sp. NPDC079020]|uniref:arginase family protein n=1 Tax=Streptomyces sp. NPDC079020 TaxID=3365722 RepID=UPI0037CF95BF
MTAASRRHAGTVLMIAPGATRQDTPQGGADLIWPQDGRRIALGRTSLHILMQFAVPATASSVADRMERSAPGSMEVVNKAVATLVEAGALCEREVLHPTPSGRGSGLFGTPVVKIDDAMNGTDDFVVIGAPYDHGVTYRPGARFGPEVLRRVSTTVYRAEAGRRGVYDVETDSRLLAGVGIADIGDVSAAPGGLGEDLLEGLEEIVALTAHSKKVPVVLGGDHSITLRVVDGLTRHHQRLGLLHFDAHHDFGKIRTGRRVGMHHGNFLDWVVGNPAVECVAQFGIRQLTQNIPQESEKVRRWPGLTAVAADPADMVRQLPSDLVWHLTFDVDVLDPSVMPSTGTVLPGGYTYRQAETIVSALCDALPVVGVDFVEYLPGADEAPGVTTSALLLRTLHHIAAARKEPL